jgi:hypothetical protein
MSCRKRKGLAQVRRVRAHGRLQEEKEVCTPTRQSISGSVLLRWFSEWGLADYREYTLTTSVSSSFQTRRKSESFHQTNLPVEFDD